MSSFHSRTKVYTIKPGIKKAFRHFSFSRAGFLIFLCSFFIIGKSLFRAIFLDIWPPHSRGFAHCCSDVPRVFIEGCIIKVVGVLNQPKNTWALRFCPFAFDRASTYCGTSLIWPKNAIWRRYRSRVRSSPKGIGFGVGCFFYK